MEILDHGVLLLRNALNAEEQEEWLNTCFLYQPPNDVVSNDGSMYTPLFAWKYPGRMFSDYQDRQREQMEPEYFEKLTTRVWRIAQSMTTVNPLPVLKDNRLVAPRDFQPKSIRGILYPHDGKLHAHQDMFMGWVCSVSLGGSCDFFFGPNWDDDDPQRRVVRLNSGDVVLINGQVLAHGVERCYEGSQPEWWRHLVHNGTIPKKWLRMNLQFRQMGGLS